MNRLYTCLITILVMGANLVYGQADQGYLVIKGSAKTERTTDGGFKIQVYNNGLQEKVYPSDDNGKFEFNLELNSRYEIIVTKQGYYSKKLAFNTVIPKDEEGIWNYKFLVTMIPEIPGFDASLLDQPIGKIMYVEKVGEFDYDEDYTNTMLKKLEALMKAYEKARKVEYEKVIAKADEAFNNKNYDEAMELYDKAIDLDPYSPYPDDQMYQIGRIVQQDQNAQKNYADNIAAADTYFRSQDYTNAVKYYKRALNYKKDVYPTNQIAAIEKILENQTGLSADQLAQNKAYSEAIALADKSFAEKQYEPALANYNKASGIKPAEQYPKDKIAEISLILAQLANNQNKQAETEKAYKAAIAQADASMVAKDYTSAKAKYQQASQIKPVETYPKTKIAEIDNLLAGQRSIDEKYLGLIALADKAFTSKDYIGAKNFYQQGLGIKPNESYPKQKIAEIDGILMQLSLKQKDTDANYLKLIAAADASFIKKDYEIAKSSYNQALAVKPTEGYPKTRITEIDRILADLATMKRNYDLAIARADNNFNTEKWNEAKIGYQEALAIFPAELYPQTRINEIDNKLLALKSADDQKLARENAYQQAIAQGELLFNQKKYQEALNAYTKALSIKPNEPMPQNRITEIDGILAQLKDLDGRYNTMIATANQHLVSKNYNDAKTTYINALQLKPNEEYPKQKIAEIDQILNSQLSLDKRYNQIILSADQLFQDKNYKDARTTYQNASEIKPNEVYPKQKISEIDALLVAIVAKQAKDDQNKKQYDQLILQADSQFKLLQYTQAKSLYTEASKLLPNEVYPKQKLVEIENILAGMLDRDTKYNDAIAKGDQLLATKMYGEALSSFNQAITLKPNEAYPKQKVAEINRILEDLRKNESAYENFIKLADAAYTNNQLESAKGQYQAALAIKPAEAYPKQRIAEIDKLLAEQARLLAERERLDTEYKNLIIAADLNVNQQKYDEAKLAYSKALQLKPNEIYPKEKLQEIDGILTKLAANQKLYEQKIGEGANLLASKNYQGALGAYQQASSIKPNEGLPKQKISEIQAIIADMNAKTEQYRTLILQADNLFKQKNYAGAKPVYQQALAIQPAESYPKTQLASIDALLAEEAKKLAALEQQKAKYNAKIVEADGLFTKKDYSNALNSYMDAKMIKPDESYPDQQMASINQILKDNALKLETDYQNAIKQGDSFKTSKQYDNAKQQYLLALKLKPNDAQAKARITEIDNLIEQDRRNLDQQAKLDADYLAAITQADNAYKASSYSAAISQYKSAQAIKPNEKYPKDQIMICERKMQDQKAIAAADAEKKRQAELAATQALAAQTKDFDYAGEKRDDKFLNELSKLYPEGVTVENYDKPNKKIKRVIVNHNGIAKEYIEVTYSYGTYYFRNGQNISRSIFYSETKE